MTLITELKDRKDLGFWLNQAGLIGVGVEVGSLYGEYMEQIMGQWMGKLLHCIDPWERQDPSVYKEPVNESDWDQIYRSAKGRADKFPGRVNLIRGYSPDESGRFADGFLDFVYIDANHSYSSACMDIDEWWPKVKRGGLFGGHDYRTDTTWPQNCEVERAVNEFCAARGMPKPHTTFAPGDCSWWIVKP
jgi:hypothetical protein